MFRKSVALSFILMAGIMTACDTGDEFTATNLSYTVLHQGMWGTFDGNYTEKTITALRDAERYEDVLAEYSAANPADIDFTQGLVLLLDAGMKSSTGFDIGIHRVEGYNRYTIVEVTYTIPGDGCIVGTALTNPYKFVYIPSREPVLVQEIPDVTLCQS